MHVVVHTQELLNPNPDDHQPLNTKALQLAPPFSPLALLQQPQPPVSPTLPPLPLVSPPPLVPHLSPPLSQPQRPPASSLLPPLPPVFQPQSTMCSKDDMATTYSSGGFLDYGSVFDGLCDILRLP